MLCQVVFQGKREIPLCHMPNLALQTLKLSFVKLGSDLNELQSGSGLKSLQDEDTFFETSVKGWLCITPVLEFTYN